MRKALLITIVFLLLTLSITQSAIAQRQNIITNQTTEPLYVVYSTKFGAHDAIPAGYWTAGWEKISAGQQKTLWAYDPHKIYFQIWKGYQRVKPLSSTQTLAFWINRNADFNVVTQQEINASITRGQLVHSSHDTSALTHSDGFMRYNNGSQITVTNAWVNVDADVNAGLDSVTDRQVFVWDPVEILRGHTGAINALAWHPTNSQRLASGSSDKAVRVWHFAEITTSVPLVGHTGAVLDVAWNSAGTELNSAGSDGTVRIWDPTIGSLIEVRLEKAHPIVAISFKRNLWFYTTEPEETSLDLSWDTKHAVVGLTDNTIQVWSVEPLNHLRDLTGHTGSVNAVVWSPDDARVVSGSADGTARIWDPQTGRLLKTLRGHTGAINTVAWSPDGTRIVSGSDDGTVRIWDADVGELLETLRRHTGAVNAVAWSPDGTRIASGGADSTIWIWEKPDDSDMMSNGFDEDVFDTDMSDGDAQDVSQPVNIPDSYLRKAIEKALGKTSGATITESDMLKLTELTISGPIIDTSFGFDRELTLSLRGLNFATNLQGLILTNLSIKHVVPLAGLTKLTHLDLAYNRISDISPLAGLTNLTYLRLEDNKISDISPLRNLTKLTELHLDGTGIVDISPLRNLTKLTELNLTVNHIVDVSPLSELTNLTYLRLDVNEIWDFSPIAGLIPNLTHYSNTKQRGLDTPVTIPDPKLRFAIEKALGKTSGAATTAADMLKLTELEADKQGIQDITGLKFATNLTRLSLEDNSIVDISPLANLKNLTRLSLGNNSIVDISPLINLKNLTRLFLGNTYTGGNSNQVSDISPLANLKNLTALYLSDNSVVDISPLINLKNLTTLFLGNNSIVDISPLVNLKNLTWLILHSNHVMDFSPIAELIPNLEYYENHNQSAVSVVAPNTPVNISSSVLRKAIEEELGKAEGATITRADMLKLTSLSVAARVNDLSGLEFAANLRGFSYLRLSDHTSSLSDLSPLSKLKNLTELYLIDTQVSDISPLANLKNLTRLDLEDNQIVDITPLAELKNLTSLDLRNNHISDFSPINGLIPNLRVYHNSPQRLFVKGCRTQMSADLEPLKPVRVTPRIERKTMSSEVGASFSVTKTAVYSQGGQNRLWTPEDTVASSEEEKYSLVLTVEFLDGWKFEDERRLVEKAATAWALSGNILFKFVSSGKSDIRVRFDDKKTGFWESNIGAPKGWDPEEHWNSDEHTMYLTTDLSYGTVLHEFGHALGLTHEHLSPEFKKYFAWKFSGEELYNEISKYYSKAKPPPYQTPPTKKDKERMDGNILKLHEVDEEKSFFDIESVMTYGLGDALLEILPAADQKTKDIFAQNEGIPHGGSSLSSGDRKFIAQCYGDPIARAKISGKVRVDGEDKDSFSSHDTIDVTKPIHPHIVGHHHLFHGREDRAMEFKWGGECRVEVYLTTRKIENQEVEVGVSALLYEGAWLDGGEDTDDLEDIRCRSFKVPVGGTRLIKISLKNVSWGARDIDSREISCKELDIDFKDGGMRGDLIGGGGDWADVYVTVSASYVSTTFAAAAPSMIVASDTSVSETAGQMLASDVNGDGIINVADLVLVSNYLGQTGSIDPRVDVNGDGIVTIADLVQVARHLGTSTYSTYSSAPSRVVVPAGLKYATVKGWIDQARVENDGSFAFQQGIAKLEYLLTLIIPEKTALLPNYPNPFNPETWIPYHLEKPADVTLTIYAVDGNVVRTLALGHQVAGYYQSKSRAAYWDGRNAVGERVASGIYFYTLTVGDFAATKKLLIRK